MSSKYQIPKKVPVYMRRLEIMYRSDSSSIYHQIICNASAYVREEISYDNWNGGTAGHALILFLEEEILQKEKVPGQINSDDLTSTMMDLEEDLEDEKYYF